MVTWYAENDARFQELIELRDWYYAEQKRIGYTAPGGWPIVKVKIERYGRHNYGGGESY